MAKQGPEVRGTCKACGHTTKTRAEPRRLTWKGDCPKCGAPDLYCKQIPGPPPAAAPVPARQVGAVTVVEVEAYDDDGPDDDGNDDDHGEGGNGPESDDVVDDPEHGERDDLEEGEGDGAGVQEGGGEGAGPDRPDGDDDGATEPAGRRARRRRKWRLRRDVSAGELIPGIYR